MRNWIRDWQRRLVDVGLLLVVATVSTGVMQIRGNVDRRVEMKRGDVRYDRHISTAQALRFAQTMADLGIFNGQPRALRLSGESQGIVVTMVVDQQLLMLPGVAEGMRREMQEICKQAFPGSNVSISFADRYLKPLPLPAPPVGAQSQFHPPGSLLFSA